MASSHPLLQIGAFARLTGVTPSMLRFYADCGLVTPAHVDPVSGYRRYSADQVDRVRLVRRLRELGLPLPVVSRTLEAPLAEAEAVVRHRLEQLERELAAARVSARAVSRLLGERSGWVSVTGGALAAALERVAPAAAGCPQAPVLAGVLLCSSPGELQLVATDRHRLAVHNLPVTGPDAAMRVVVPVEDAEALSGWAAGAELVGLRTENGRLTARRDDGAVRGVRSLPGQYPDHRLLLDGLGRPVTRVTAARDDLLAALSGSAVSRLSADPAGGLQIEGTDTTARPVAASVQGTPVSMAFQRSTLWPAVRASVGPDVLLELTGPEAPAVVRSADDGTFTTLAMPVRHPARDRRAA
ncbi:MerR family transcriptional regulator [uncultured Modestobacter sp.]|uniref:DNA polymerase III subunit beta family protein n=1 Tax=uncultured Modestobacter sp. TaxID=380048 RepID=UPI002634146C|nr:MerR family transcriptional regulator [uncultured Modestobacter sp.]